MASTPSLGVWLWLWHAEIGCQTPRKSQELRNKTHSPTMPSTQERNHFVIVEFLDKQVLITGLSCANYNSVITVVNMIVSMVIHSHGAWLRLHRLQQISFPWLKAMPDNGTTMINMLDISHTSKWKSGFCVWWTWHGFPTGVQHHVCPVVSWDVHDWPSLGNQNLGCSFAQCRTTNAFQQLCLDIYGIHNGTSCLSLVKSHRINTSVPCYVKHWHEQTKLFFSNMAIWQSSSHT